MALNINLFVWSELTAHFVILAQYLIQQIDTSLLNSVSKVHLQWLISVDSLKI